MRQGPSTALPVQYNPGARSARSSTDDGHRHVRRRLAGSILPATALTVLAALTPPVSGTSPSFDCAKADGSVEGLILTINGPHQGADQVIAFLAPAASGSRYEAAKVMYWEHHGEATLTWFGDEILCEPLR